MPYIAFDRLFVYDWWECPAVDTGWFYKKESPDYQKFILDCFTTVLATQATVRQSPDELTQFELESISSYQHVFDFQPDVKIHLTPPDTESRTKAGQSVAYYRTLSSLLDSRMIRSVTIHGICDFHTIKILCKAQRARRNGQLPPLSDLYICTPSSSDPIKAEPWGCLVRYSVEGLAPSNLFIENVIYNNTPIKAMVEKYGRNETRWYLSSRDEGTIDGYKMDSGDGWWLYERISRQPN